MLLISDSKLAIIWSAISGLAGTALLAVAAEGYLTKRLIWPLRVLFMVAAVMLIAPGIRSDLIGFGMAVVAGAGVKFLPAARERKAAAA